MNTVLHTRSIQALSGSSTQGASLPTRGDLSLGGGSSRLRLRKNPEQAGQVQAQRSLMRWKHTLEAVHARPRGAPPSARERRCPVEGVAPERSCPVGVRLGGLTAGV